MRLKLPLGINLMCVCCASDVVDTEAKRPCGTCTYVDESYICSHHVSKDFCTPVMRHAVSLAWPDPIFTRSVIAFSISTPLEGVIAFSISTQLFKQGTCTESDNTPA